MQSVIDWFSSLWLGFVDFLYKLILTFFDFLKDFLWWVIDMLIQAIILVLSGLDLSLNTLSPLTYIDQIPDETKYFMSAVGFNESMGMLVAAITIRLTLRLIPFVRL